MLELFLLLFNMSYIRSYHDQDVLVLMIDLLVKSISYLL